MTPTRLAKVCAGRVVRSGPPASVICTDSREVSAHAGACFVAMPGASADGHQFVANAFAQGATGVIVSRELERTAIPDGRFVVSVADTATALLRIAAEHRRRHETRVVGITGSCGKTSTKDMLGHVLAQAMPTVWSPKSYNNHVGVPLSLLQIRSDTRAAVIEIGTNAPGEIAALTAVAEPDIGIVTCVSEAHLAGLGSLEGIAREKGSLLAGLREGGLAILNGDDRSCRKMAETCGVRSIQISVCGKADWFATDVEFHGLGTVFRLQGEHPVTLPRIGSHNVYNALLAIAAATELGVPLDSVLQSLRCLDPTARRLERRQCGDVTVYDDTYNMNPSSSRAALNALAGLVPRGRKIVVFGEMLELGEQSARLHRELGASVAGSGVDLLITVGERAEQIALGAIEHGLAAEAVAATHDLGAAFDAVTTRIAAGDVVLLKASRGVGLDRLVDRLLRELPSRKLPTRESSAHDLPARGGTTSLAIGEPRS